VNISAFVLCLLSFVLSATAGEAYTNLAGRAIVATPVKVENGQVTFDCGADGVRALPMNVFPLSEQVRIRAAVGQREMPGELRALAAEIASQRKRAEARTKAGRMTPEKLAEYRENLSAGWCHAVDETKLTEEEKSYWRNRCP